MSDDHKERIAKAAGYLALSGIAISIIKSINPFQKPQLIHEEIKEPIQLVQQINCVSSLPEPIIKPIACFDEKEAESDLSTEKTVDVVKGDTLLILSQKYGVSIEAIKEANELIGDTIYPGKKQFVRSSKYNESC